MQGVPGVLTADSQPTIQVIATTSEGTRAALATAVPLARGLAAKLVLIVPRIVPYAVELDASCESTASPANHLFRNRCTTPRVDTVNAPEALWMSGQLPVHWVISGPFSATVRPEFCWDRDGRWTGFRQRVVALTAGGEYRVPFQG